MLHLHTLPRHSCVEVLLCSTQVAVCGLLERSCDTPTVFRHIAFVPIHAVLHRWHTADEDGGVGRCRSSGRVRCCCRCVNEREAKVRLEDADDSTSCGPTSHPGRWVVGVWQLQHSLLVLNSLTLETVPRVALRSERT